MTHQTTPPELNREFPELELSLKLSQLEGAFKFLDYMNNELHEAKRNVTEQRTVKSSLTRVIECRNLFKQIINSNRAVRKSSISNEQLANQQFLHDS